MRSIEPLPFRSIIKSVVEKSLPKTAEIPLAEIHRVKGEITSGPDIKGTFLEEEIKHLNETAAIEKEVALEKVRLKLESLQQKQEKIEVTIPATIVDTDIFRAKTKEELALQAAENSAKAGNVENALDLVRFGTPDVPTRIEVLDTAHQMNLAFSQAESRRRYTQARNEYDVFQAAIKPLLSTETQVNRDLTPINEEVVLYELQPTGED